MIAIKEILRRTYRFLFHLNLGQCPYERMIKMKKALTSAAALLIALGLFACGGNRQPDETSNVPGISKNDGGSEKHEHTFNEAKWESNESYHWHAATCEHTTQTKDKAGHQWGEAEVIKAATCDTAGSQKKTCKTCGYEKTEEVAAKGHNYKDATNGEAFQVAKCECGETILSQESQMNGKWTKGTTWEYTFSNKVAAKGKVIIGCAMSSSSHEGRTLYVNSEGASADDAFESDPTNTGICRMDIKINGGSLNLYQGTYAELGLTTEVAQIALADVTMPAGTFTISITTHEKAGYRLVLGGQVSVSCDNYQKA